MADTQLAETLFTAMDEIIHKRIEDLPYDKTILATIESNKNAETLGEYIVNDGSTTMRAYSDNHSYREGDKVYVSIPQGNYNEQKNIVGLYITDSDGQVSMNYNDPLSDLVDITGNIYDNEQDVYALTANDRSRPDTGRIWYWSAKDYDENPFMEFGVLGLSASFKTTIGRFDSIASGQYGIRLNIVAIRNAQQTLTDNKIYYTFELDSNDFFGDPYNFETYYKQAKIVHLREKDVSRIDEMEIIFYQKNNFFNVNGDYISPDINENALTEDGLIGNLFVKDIELKFGYDIQEFQNKNDTVILYSANPRTYINKITDNVKIKYPTEEFDSMEFFQKENFLNSFNKKKVICRWIHKNEDGILEYYGGNGEELPEQACIKWYRYHYTDQDNSFKYSNPPGDYWELIPDNDEVKESLQVKQNALAQLELNYQNDLKELMDHQSLYQELTEEEYQQAIEDLVAEYQEQRNTLTEQFDSLSIQYNASSHKDDDFTVTLTPDIYNVSEKIKAVVWNPSQEYITEKKENNNQYIDASEYSEASFVMVLNMNPLHYLSLIFTDERYKAYFRKQCFRAPALKQLINEHYTDLKKFEPKNSDDFNNEELIKKYNEAFDLIYASNNTEDTFFISQFIQQACYDMNLHLQFYNIFQYIRITNGNDYETEQDKLNAELALLENFYTTNYKELIELDVISYPGRFFSANDKSRIQELLEDFVSDRQNCELYSISLSSQLEDYSLNNTLNTLFMGEGSPYQAVEQPADTRDYKQIKILFTELPDKVDKAIKEYSEAILKKEIKEQWKNAVVNSSDFISELLYRQCIYYNNFNNLYEDKYKDQTQIGNMINGEAAYIISNEIEFTNEDPDAWRDFDSIKSLRLTVDPEYGTNGVFRFYNDDSSIVNDGEAQKVRKIVANYTNAYSGRAEIDVAEEVEWWIPRNYTMILPPEEGQDYNLYDLKNINSVDFANGTYYTRDIEGYHVASTYSTEQSYYIKNDVEFFDEYDPLKLKELRYMDILSNYYIVRKKMPLKDYTTYGEEEATKCEMGFRVRNYYIPDAKNNTIHCIVTRNNKKVEADATLTFGIKGIMGTDYTLILETETDRAVIPVGGEPFKVAAKLYDYMGNDITDTVNTYNFSWYSSGNGGLTTDFQTTEDEPNKIIITPDKNKPIEDYAHYVLEVVVPADNVLVGGNHMQVDFHALLPIVVVKDNFDYSYMDNVEIQTIEEIEDLPELQELPEVLKDDQQIIDYYKSIINYVTRMTSEYDEKIASNQTELEEQIRQINALSILTEEERTNRINAETEKYNKVINQYQELKNSLNSQGISNIKKILVNQVSIVRYDGKSNISYDNTGCNPVNYKNEFKLYFRNKANAIQQVAPNSQNTVTWGTMYSFPTTVDEAIAKGELTAEEVAEWELETREEYEAYYQNNIKYFPKMENGKIVPQPLYMVPDASKSEISSAKCTVNGQIVFIMPLVMTQRVYNSKLLNNWSGELTIDQNNGTILSAMVGTGCKDDQNRFQGILMGNVADAADQNADIGIYGYNEGVQSFGFRIDGTAFIGKSSIAQIIFDGNTGIIQNSGYIDDRINKGIQLRFGSSNPDEQPKLHFKNGNKSVLISTNGSDEEGYFKVTVNSDPKNLIFIGDSSYYIQSQDYSNWNRTTVSNPDSCRGSYINLSNGQIFIKDGTFVGNIYGSTIFGGSLGIGGSTSSDITTYNTYINGDGKLVTNDIKVTGGEISISGIQDIIVNGGQSVIQANCTVTIANGAMAFMSGSGGGGYIFYDTTGLGLSGLSSLYLGASGGGGIFLESANIIRIDSSSITYFAGQTVFENSITAATRVDFNGSVHLNSHVFFSMIKSNQYQRELRITTEGAVFGVNIGSSKRYKHNIKLFNNNSLILDLYNIPIYTFEYNEDFFDNEEDKKDERRGQTLPGFIVEDLDEILPEAVEHDSKGLPTMWNYQVIVPLMFEMIKNNHKDIQQLQQEIKELKEKIK